MSSLPPALRKAAILISALDPAAVDRLLDPMGEQQAARIRSAVMELDDVDPQEQEAILAEFFGRAPAADDGGVELQMSAASQHVATQIPVPSAPPAASEPTERFRFLYDATSEQLAARLRDEHPQLIAQVAAHLPAEKGAEFLERLSAPLRAEVLDRLGDLDEVDPEVVAELERELERMFAGTLRPRVRNAKRHDHLQAILGHLRRRELQVSAAEVSAQTAASRISAQHDSPPHSAHATRPAEHEERHYAPRFERSLSTGTSPALPPPQAEPPAMAFEQLASLTAMEFFGVFEEADPRVVMLALAGASRRLFERYVSQFSTDRALEFERHLEQLRPLRLRDVEAAQQELASLAGRRLHSAKAAAESSRRFAAAA